MRTTALSRREDATSPVTILAALRRTREKDIVRMRSGAHICSGGGHEADRDHSKQRDEGTDAAAVRTTIHPPTHSARRSETGRRSDGGGAAILGTRRTCESRPYDLRAAATERAARTCSALRGSAEAHARRSPPWTR